MLSACLVGAGEYITRSALARAIGEALEISDQDANAHNILHQILLDRFWSGSLQIKVCQSLTIQKRNFKNGMRIRMPACCC